MYKHILIATDGSDLSGKGLDHGLALAKSLGAAVTVVTVTANEIMPYSEMAEEVRRGNNPLEMVRAAMEKEANEILDAASEKARAAGVEIKTLHIPERHAAEGILEAARENNCDVIIMSSHGRRGLRRLMLGSQTAEVVTTGTIPVLVIR